MEYIHRGGADPFQKGAVWGERKQQNTNVSEQQSGSKKSRACARVERHMREQNEHMQMYLLSSRLARTQ